MKIYGDAGSGNCHKVKLTADYLGIPNTWIETDITQGRSRTPEALARNPQGQVPTIELEDGRCLAQSNAIIRYLAHGTELLPDDPFEQAKVDEWLFWEQYSHEPYIAVCRYQMVYLDKGRDEREPWRVERGEAALDLMDRMLAERDWFAGGDTTVADVALLAYTRMADEGGFDLAPRAHVRDWIARCERKLGTPRIP